MSDSGYNGDISEPLLSEDIYTARNTNGPGRPISPRITG